MDVILIYNGLGNQMSQYAFYLKKKQLSGSARYLFLKKSKNIHNGYELDKVFGIAPKDAVSDTLLYYFYLALAYKKLKPLSRSVIKFFGKLGFRLYDENGNYAFQPGALASSSGITFFVGGWHSAKYFNGFRNILLEAFRFDTARLGPANLAMLDRIKSTNSVSVHVRRGDFLNAENYQKFGSVTNLNYFLLAIQKMRSMVDNPHFFFFTNDTAWVRENFTGSDLTVVEINSGGDSWKDMFLISRCCHNICSNGSFSWWGAYLNSNENKHVIVPKHFVAYAHFEDMYPDDWIQLSDY